MAQTLLLRVLIRIARTVTLIFGPMVAFITEAAVNTVLLTTPLVLCAVQLFTGVGLICRNSG